MSRVSVSLREQAGDHQRQCGVLGPEIGIGAVERLAADDANAIHCLSAIVTRRSVHDPTKWTWLADKILRQANRSRGRGPQLRIRDLRKLDCFPQNRRRLLPALQTSADYGESPVLVPKPRTGPLFFTA